MKYDKDKLQIIRNKNFTAGITQNKMPFFRCSHLYKSLKLKSPDNITVGDLYELHELIILFLQIKLCGTEL